MRTVLSKLAAFIDRVLHLEQFDDDGRPIEWDGWPLLVRILDAAEDAWTRVFPGKAGRS